MTSDNDLGKCPVCKRELIPGTGHTWTWNGTTQKGFCFEIPERVMEAFELYDLAVPAKPIFPSHTPLRRSLSGPETHTERMARTDLQLEEERRRLALHDAFTTAQVEWARVRSTYEAWRNAPAHAVLDLHRPVGKDWSIECEECSGHDYYGENGTAWPCDTFMALRELAR